MNIPINEKHYTAPELAKLWHLDPKTIRRMFKGVPGVIFLPQKRGIRGRQKRQPARYPASAVELVHRKLENKTA
jgi:methylphosphotriester-DNA--protein-cysteine methyltransferase